VHNSGNREVERQQGSQAPAEEADIGSESEHEADEGNECNDEHAGSGRVEHRFLLSGQVTVSLIGS
jgi:hypothetical protein